MILSLDCYNNWKRRKELKTIRKMIFKRRWMNVSS